MGLKLALVIVVLNVGLSLCKIGLIEPESVHLFTRPDSSQSVARFVASKIVRRLESATNNQEVYDTLFKSDGYQVIQGKFTARNYYGMAYLSVEWCLVDQVASRKAACDAAKIPSLRTYCKYCLEKLTEYCNENKDWMAQHFMEFFRGRGPANQECRDVSRISREIDRYISGIGEETNPEEKSVKDFCAATKDLKTKIAQCDTFLARIKEFSNYQSDQEKLLQIVEENTTGLYGERFHKLEAPLRRCKIMKKECTGFRFG